MVGFRQALRFYETSVTLNCILYRKQMTFVTIVGTFEEIYGENFPPFSFAASLSIFLHFSTFEISTEDKEPCFYIL